MRVLAINVARDHLERVVERLQLEALRHVDARIDGVEAEALADVRQDGVRGFVSFVGDRDDRRDVVGERRRISVVCGARFVLDVICSDRLSNCCAAFFRA